MREQFVKALDREHAQMLCPWARKIVKVNGGYLCFEDIYDYRVWQNQG